MTTQQVKQQKPADKVWLDEQGTAIPYNRTNSYERKAESGIARMAREAIALNRKLSDFKADIRQTAEVLYREFVEANGGKVPGKGKGAVTLYNFDRSIKLEVRINEQLRFDEEYIKLAKAELDDLLKESLKEVSDWIEPLIMSAFEKSKGELDTDKVLSLKKHASRIKDERYHKAMGFIDKSIIRGTSKEYYCVWLRTPLGGYESVNLQFSAL